MADGASSSSSSSAGGDGGGTATKASSPVSAVTDTHRNKRAKGKLPSGATEESPAKKRRTHVKSGEKDVGVGGGGRDKAAHEK